MKIPFLLPVAALTLIASCGNEPTEPAPAVSEVQGEEQATAQDTSVSQCADEGDVLELSGICEGRAINFIDEPVIDEELEFYNDMTGETCAWEVMEIPFATDILLYQGVVCGENKASLEFSAGAQAAHIYLASSPYGPDMGDLDTPIVKVFSVNPDDVFANIQFRAREAMEDKDAAEECTVVQAGIPGWPTGALVVDDPAEADAHDPNDGPRAACGPYGLNQDETNFWLIRDGFSWFFQLGQEPIGIAPGSFTLLTEDENGDWGRM